VPADVPADVPFAAEQRAPVLIDQQLCAAGLAVVDRQDLNLFAPQGSAVHEAIMAPGHGRSNYLLYVDKQVVGVRRRDTSITPWLSLSPRQAGKRP